MMNPVGTSPRRPPRPAAARWESLDITKGALIVIMIVYHWAYYFLHASHYFYDFLRFITPSFIFITGFLVMILQVAKYGLGPLLYQKLLLRGVKLFALFVALNLAINSLLPERSRSAVFGLPSFFSDLSAILVTGNSRSASFKILLPIAYVLILSIGLAHVTRLGPVWRALIMLGVVGLMQWLEFAGINSANLVLITFGFLGLTTATAGRERIDRMADHPVALCIPFVLHGLLLLLWGPLYFIQVLGVLVYLILLYALSRQWLTAPHAPMLVKLGQYSLLCYILHIGLLQALLPALRIGNAGLRAALALLATLVLTVSVTYGLDWLRPRLAIIDRGYRAVFS